MLENHLSDFGFFFTPLGIIVDVKANNPFLPLALTIEALSLTVDAFHVDGSIISLECQSALTDEALLAQGFQVLDVKTALISAEQAMQPQLLRAYHWISWDRQSKYCGRCGSLLESAFNVTEKKCPSCNLSIFPKFSPAVMVLIYREKEILLARSPHFREGMYSVIAGFIDIGETAEQAAHREVMEELGLKIVDLEYFSSQPWPFPDSLMIAFKAKAINGDIKIDPNEIEDAGWFSIDELPTLPIKLSIARQLIDSVCAELKLSHPPN